MFQFLKEFFVYGMTSMMSKLVAIFLMPIYTNILTQEEYGVMALLTSCVGIIGMFSNLEIHTGIARDYYEEGVDRKKLVSTGFFSILSVSLLVLVFMLSTLNFWADNVLDISNYKLPFFVILLSVPTTNLHSYFATLMRFKKKPFLFSLGSLLQLLLQVSISIIGVVVLRYGIVSIFSGLLIGEIFAILFFAYFSRYELSFTFCLPYLKRALLYGIPLLPAVLANWIDGSFGQILIGKFISKADLGVYSVALSFVSIFSLITLSLKNAWLPFLYENYKKPNFNSQAIGLYKAVVIVLFIIVVSLSLLSKEVVILLSNSSYVAAAQYISLLCLPSALYLLFPIVSSGIQITRETKYTAIAYVLGSLFNLLSMVLFMPKFGIIVVPLSLSLSRLISYAILYIFTRQKKILVLPNQYVVVLVLCSLFSYFIVLCDFSLWWRILFVAVFDGIMLFILNKKFSILVSVLLKIKK